MKALNVLTDAINAKLVELDAVNAQINDFQQQIEAIEDREQALSLLAERRRDVLANSIISGAGVADTIAIDAEIQAVKEAAAGDADLEVGLMRAIELRKEAVDALEKEVRDLVRDRKEAAFQICSTALTEVESEMKEVEKEIDGLMRKAVSYVAISGEFGSPQAISYRLQNLIASTRCGKSAWASHAKYAEQDCNSLRETFKEHGAVIPIGSRLKKYEKATYEQSN